jgi:protein O-mannosyl-transferase
MGKSKNSKRNQSFSRSLAESAPAPTSTGSAPDLQQVWLRIGLGILLFLTLLMAYSDSFEGPFLLDNQQIILMDTRLRGADWDHVAAIFSKDYWWPTLASDLFRPITTLTYMINYSVFGCQEQPFGYHLTNFLLHLCNVWLVYAVLRQMGTRRMVGYWAAAIYGLHPIATEAVANIVGRADLLVTLFVLSGTLCYIHSTKVTGQKKLQWLLGLTVFSILGVLSKESGVMILPAMFFYDWLYRYNIGGDPLPKSLPSLPWRARLRTLLPGYLFIVPALLTFVGCRYWMMTTSPTYGNPFVDNPIEISGFIEGRMTALKVLGQYCGMLIWPSVLSCDWSYNQIPLFNSDAAWHENLQAYIAIVLILSLFVLAWASRKKYPLVTLGILWFAVAIFPVSNLPITIGSIKGERLLYLPFFGFALIAGMGLERFRGWIAGLIQPPKTSLLILSFAFPVIIFAALGFRTFLRNDDWSSEYKLWSSAVQACPKSFKTYKGFSNYFVGLGTEAGVDIAIKVAERGVYVLEHPQLSLPRKDNTLYINMAFHYARKAEMCLSRNAPDEANVFFNKALITLDKAMEVDHYANGASRAKFIRLGVAPENIRDVGNPTVYELRTAVFLGLNRLDDAEEAAKYNLRLNPFSTRANILLAEIYARRNNLDRAAIYWIRSLLFDPSSKQSWENLQRAYAVLSPEQPALRPMPNGSVTLLKDNPVVKRHLVIACAETYQLLLDTIRIEEAMDFRKKAATAYDCPLDLLPIPPRLRDKY